MVGTLLETRAAKPRRIGGTVTSVALHSGVIGLLVAITAHAAPRPTPATAAPVPVVYIAPIPAHAVEAPAAPTPPDAPPVAAPPTIALPPIAPVAIPTNLPSIDTHVAMPIPNWPDARTGPPVVRFTSEGPGTSSGPADGIWNAERVDRAVVGLAGNPTPIYPTALRAAQVEGTVDVQFVVDTTGRAEPSSIKVLAATHARFADAVRDAILGSRYRPAEAHGAVVRQLVQQRFEFALRR